MDGNVSVTYVATSPGNTEHISNTVMKAEDKS
jgi:hypothetical protein